MKKILALLLAAVMALCCASALAGETPTVGGELVIALGYEPDIMNVYSTHLMGDVQAMVVEGLLVPNQNMEYEPVLAKEVPSVNNGLIVLHDDGTMDITYNLRDDVYWHDGEKFTSNDVKVTWETICNPDWDAESKEGAFDIDSIECPDDYTVICHYNKQTPDFAQTLFTFGIMPAHVIEGLDMNDPNNAYNSNPCGTGPYKFQEWAPGEYIKLVRNENYYKEGAYIDTVTFRFISDEMSRINELKAGTIDFAYGISATNFNLVENLDGYHSIVHPTTTWRYFDFNCAVPGLSDVVVRRAMECAIDKEGICESLFYNVNKPWDQPWMPSDPFHVEGFETEWKFDLDKANTMLDEAGWVKGADGVRAKDGVRLDFTISCRSGHTDELIADVLVDYFSEIGIATHVETMASSTLTANMYAGKYQLALGGYITSPGATRTHMFAIGGELNRGSWADEEFTEISHKIDVELDEQTRKDLVAQALKLFDSGVPQVVLYSSNEIIIVSDKLQGFLWNPTNMTNFCQSAGWWIAE